MDVEPRYQAALSYLFSQFPQYQNVGAVAYKSGLEGMIELDHILEHPHQRFRSVHVAGTNGKGSVSHILAAILQQAGYRVGLYTSPHLIDFRERIRINGAMILKEEVMQFLEQYKSFLDKIRPSFFEITTAMAFDYFAQKEVDIAVVETGLGGRLDSTNIIKPMLSVITNIGLDHCEYLGRTLSLIATEKAGIIKPKVPIVIGERHPQTDPVFVERAAEVGAPLFFAEDFYEVTQVIQKEKHQCLIISGEEYLADLMGCYQQKNVPTALMAAKTIDKSGVDIDTEAVKRGLRDAAHTTGLRGRWECISQNPGIIVDAAHNAHGIKWAMDQLQNKRYRQLHFIFGVVVEKDLDSILPLLPKEANYYFTRAQIDRALDPHLLAERCRKVGLLGSVTDCVVDALAAAKADAGPDDLIFVGGSIFVVAEVLNEIDIN